MLNILVVDEEPSVRSMVASALRNRGFSVITAASGTEALSRWRKLSGRLDVLLSEVSMPDMDGATLGNILKAVNPNLQVILMSGGCDPSLVLAGKVKDFLPKPFSLERLFDLLKSAEGARGAGS